MKNKALIIAVFILGAIAIYLVLNNKNSTIKQELKDFAVEDTASLFKIFLADKGNQQALLERQNDGSWKVNGKFFVRKDALKILFETLKRMEIKAPVAKAAYNNVIKSIAAGAIKVELYKKNEEKPFKVIYVGGETPDHLGTYMLLENSSSPFVMQIPGFNGYLSSRFIVSEEGWRDRSIFNYSNPTQQISSIALENFNKPEESFKINIVNGQIKSISGLKNNISIDYDSAKVMGYIARFTQVGYESIVSGLPQTKVDSILTAVPVFIFTISTIDGKEKSVIIHPMAADKGVLDINGKPMKFNLDRFYAQIISPEGKDFTVAQYYVFDRLIKPLNFFKK